MCRVMRCIHHEPQNLMITDDNDKLFPIAIRNRYEILVEECSCLRVVRLLEVRSPVDHRVLDNEQKLMSARRPGAYCICNLLRLKHVGWADP